MVRLPIDEVIDDVVAAARTRGAVVVRAAPGAGKTTRVPPALLDAGLGPVVVLEPRRLAARAAARRIASERGSTVGGEIGWHVRFDRRAGPDTRLLVVTEGLLVRMLQDDPFLEGFGCVVVDEVHERSLTCDLALALVRRVRADVRPDLRIVAMSATIDAGALAGWLGADVVDAPGRAFPVEVRYPPFPVDPLDALPAAVRAAFAETPGDVLAFLPGVREILRAADALADLPVRPLYGDLPAARQDELLRPGGPRKVILATNVAETSITLPDVTAVVDAGLVRQPGRDPGTGLDRLQTTRISKASAAQRAGRAGRLRAGLAVRLWTEREHAALPDADVPEVARVDLAAPVLELLCWGETRPEAFEWLDPPPADAVAGARAVLADLGATDGGRVTPLGRLLGRLPLHPRLGRLVVEGHRLGHRDAAARLAALLAERDPTRAGSDLLDRLDALDRGLGDPDGIRAVRRAAEQIARFDLGPQGTTVGRDEALRRAVLAAFPDRVARRRPERDRAVLTGGRGVRVAPGPGDLLVAVDVDAGERGSRDGVVRATVEVEPAWLAVTTGVEVAFDPATERVVAVRRRRYRDLVLEEGPAQLPAADLVATALAEAAARDPAHALGLDAPDVAAVLARIAFLRDAMPELGLPDARAAVVAALPTACVGRRSFAELRAGAVDAVLDTLTWPQRQALDREAPERIEVPSGSRIRVQWETGRPVLPVRMQELFGLADTPRVAGGRVRVLLHLLAPNQRPQQVTDDLAGFWARTWPEVRKELRARYPKHAWPDDPRVAVAESRPRRR